MQGKLKDFPVWDLSNKKKQNWKQSYERVLKLKLIYFSHFHLLLRFCWGSAWWMERVLRTLSDSWVHYTLNMVVKLSYALTNNSNLENVSSQLSLVCSYSRSIKTAWWQHVKQGVLPWHRLLLCTITSGIFISEICLQSPGVGATYDSHASHFSPDNRWFWSKLNKLLSCFCNKTSFSHNK